MATPLAYFVVSRAPTTGGAWVPTTSFALHLPPMDLEVEPRIAQKVRPLLGGVHVDTAPTTLFDVSMSVRTGQGLALGSNAAGAPSFGTGRQRAAALRDWMLIAEDRLASGGHRLEFHYDIRGHHLVVVPASRRISASSGDGTRNGGESFALAFVAIGLADMPTGLLSEVAGFVRGAEQRLADAAGAVATYLLLARQITSIPADVAGLASSTVRTIEALAVQLPLIVSGAASVATVTTEAFVSAMDGAHELVDALAALERYTDAAYWHGMADRLAAAAAGHKALSAAARPALAVGVGMASLGNIVDTATILGAEDAPTSSADGAFAKFAAEAGAYNGWIPYFASAGESLLDIAMKITGNLDAWAGIAIINEVGPVIDKPIKLKIPVMSGGIPWGPAALTDVDAAAAAMAEHVYYRDLRLERGVDGRLDIAIDPDSLRDARTITGLPNFVQRYDFVFRCDMGDNPTFPDVGVHHGIGRPTTEATRGLTRQTARAALLSDPRTVRVTTVVDTDDGDAAIVTLRVETLAAAAADIEVP